MYLGTYLPIFSQFCQKMCLIKLKIFILMSSFILRRKDEKHFMRLLWLRVKNPLCTDRCQHGPVYHITWCGNPSQWNHLRSDKLQRALYRFVFWQILSAALAKCIMFLNFRLLRPPDIILKQALGSQKQKNLDFYICTWLSCCGSFRITSALQQSPATSTCCSLSFSFNRWD